MIKWINRSKSNLVNASPRGVFRDLLPLFLLLDSLDGLGRLPVALAAFRCGLLAEIWSRQAVERPRQPPRALYPSDP